MLLVDIMREWDDVLGAVRHDPRLMGSILKCLRGIDESADRIRSGITYRTIELNEEEDGRHDDRPRVLALWTRTGETETTR